MAFQSTRPNQDQRNFWLFTRVSQDSSVQVLAQADLILIVYDVTNAHSFAHAVSNWSGQVEEHATAGQTVVLVGTKADLTRVVSPSVAQDIASCSNQEWVEISKTSNAGLVFLEKLVSRCSSQKTSAIYLFDPQTSSRDEVAPLGQWARRQAAQARFYHAMDLKRRQAQKTQRRNERFPKGFALTNENNPVKEKNVVVRVLPVTAPRATATKGRYHDNLNPVCARELVHQYVDIELNVEEKEELIQLVEKQLSPVRKSRIKRQKNTTPKCVASLELELDKDVMSNLVKMYDHDTVETMMRHIGKTYNLSREGKETELIRKKVSGLLRKVRHAPEPTKILEDELKLHGDRVRLY